MHKVETFDDRENSDAKVAPFFVGLVSAIRFM